MECRLLSLSMQQCALEDGSSIAYVSSEGDDETTPLLKDAKTVGPQKQRCPEYSTCKI